MGAVPVLVALVLLVVAVAACTGPRGGRPAPAASPSTPPADLCAVVGKGMVDALVPYADRPLTTTYRYYTRAQASCDARTDRDAATSTAYAGLTVKLVRYGPADGTPAPGQAREAFDAGCRSGAVEVTGLGDRACGTGKLSEADRTASVQLDVLSGGDVVSVAYEASPSTKTRALAAARAAATNVLAGVGGAGARRLEAPAESPFEPAETIAPVPSPGALPAVAVVGPVWQSGDKVDLVRGGLPFPFRVPAAWDCDRDLPLVVDVDAALRCGAGGRRSAADLARVTVYVRGCGAPCTPDQVGRFDQDFLDSPVQYRAFDAGTRYAEFTEAGVYRLVLVRVFGDRHGRPTRHVAVLARAAPAQAADVQRVVNDIRTQTP